MQSIDGAIFKGPVGTETRRAQPDYRGKNGSKRHLLVDARGVPLSFTVIGANRHDWFNRFRKLLVRYEKLERGFLALNHVAAGIIAFRKVRLKVNINYG